MNKKQCVYGVLMLTLIGASGQSFGMFNKYSVVFRGAQVASAGYLIGSGVNKAYERNKILKEPVEGEFVRGVVKKWARSEMKALNVEKIPFIYGDGWAISKDKILEASRSDVDTLELVFTNEPLLLKKLAEVQQLRDFWEKDVIVRGKLSAIQKRYSKISVHSRDDFAELDNLIDITKKTIDEGKKIVARQRMIFLHEMSHYTHQDSKRKMYALAGVPIAVQAFCSTVSYAFNKVCGIKAPKGVFSTLWRSSLACASTPIKLSLSGLGIILHDMYKEKCADGFACKHAQERLELEEFRNNFLESADLFEKKLAFEPESLAKNMLMQEINIDGPMIVMLMQILTTEELEELVSKQLIRRMGALFVSSKAFKNIQDKLNAPEITREDRASLEYQKNLVTQFAHCAFDLRHPDDRYRAANIQKHLDEWDKNHKEVKE